MNRLGYPPERRNDIDIDLELELMSLDDLEAKLWLVLEGIEDADTSMKGADRVLKIKTMRDDLRAKRAFLASQDLAVNPTEAEQLRVWTLSTLRARNGAPAALAHRLRGAMRRHARPSAGAGAHHRRAPARDVLLAPMGQEHDGQASSRSTRRCTREKPAPVILISPSGAPERRAAPQVPRSLCRQAQHQAEEGQREHHRIR